MKPLTTVIALVVCLTAATAQFKPDYQSGIVQVKKYKSLLKKVSSQFSLSTDYVTAVAFPEFTRYSSIQNLLETKTMELLYVKGGKDAADFSLGVCQMKPSFVEHIETSVLKFSDLASKYALLISYPSHLTEKEARTERIRRLKDVEWQFRYLCLFVELGEKIHLQGTSLSQVEKLAFLAAAYNYGLQKSKSSIESWMAVRAFPYGKAFGDKQVPYHEVAVTYYTQYSKVSLL